MEPGIDDALAEVLGPDAPEVRRWAKQVGASLRYANWEDRGNTAARLVAAHATWNRLGGTDSFSGKLILKYIPLRWKETEEPWRTADAWEAANDEFRDAHLVQQVRDPVMLPNGGWLMFLDIASGKLSELRSLSDLVTNEKHSLVIDHASVIVGQMLGALAPVEEAYPTVGGLLRELLDARIEPDGTVHTWLLDRGLVDGKPVAAVNVRVDGQPNPLALVLGDLPASARTIRVRLTGSHRDMHPGNCLVGRTVGEFWLIDQARFASKWLAAFDPMYLVVTTVAHLLPSDVRQRRDLIRLLVDPEAPPDLFVPMPLREFVIAIRAACAGFGAVGNLTDEWQVESLVALIAVALIMTGRSLIDETDREWFLHLAANAGAKLVSLLGADDTGVESSNVADAPKARDAAAPRADEPVAVDLPVLLPYLVLRGELMSQIKEFHTVRPGLAVALHGPPGVGKSQAAIEYARTFGVGYSRVVWFSGGLLLMVQFAEFARSLGIAAESDPDILRRLVFTAIRATGRRFLFIFDGVDTASEVRPFCPFSPEVDVLLTSRSPQWTQMGKPLPVGAFERGESLELLESIIGPEDGTDALAQALDDLPAAVAQAGHYLVGSGLSPRRYREQVLEETERTLVKGPLDDYGALALIWTKAIDQLRLRSSRAAEVLSVIAFYGWAPVPVELVKVVPNAGEDHGESFDDVVKMLTESGLASASSEALSCYSLLRLFVRNRFTPDQMVTFRRALGQTLVAHHPGDARLPDTWRHYHALLPHILEIGPLVAHGHDFLKLYLDSVRYLIVQGDAATAIELAEKALAEWNADGEAMIEILGCIAQAHFFLGNYGMAARLDAEVSERTRTLLGENHPNTVLAHKHAEASAAALAIARDAQVAALVFERIVNRHLLVLGARHPETLRALHNYAHFLRASGQPVRARDIDRPNYQHFIQALGQQHLDTLASGHALALDLSSCGDHEGARQLNEQIHTTAVDELGPDHLFTAQSAISLAESRRRAGEHETARQLDAVARETLSAARGADHRLTLLAAHGLAKDLLALGDIEQAVLLAEDTYDRRVRVLGPENLETIRSGRLLAQVAERDGDVDWARELKARMAELLAASYGEQS